MKHFDWSILISALIICGFGTAIISSVAHDTLVPQAAFYAIGLGLFFLFSRIDHRIYDNLGRVIYALAIALFAITLLLGLESRGAIRWIPVGPFRLQFSEIFKPFLICAFAFFLGNHDGKKLRVYILSLAWVALPMVLVFKQPDLGSTIVYATSFLAMLLASGTSFGHLLLSFLGLGLSLPVVWRFLADYQKNRILSFISPHVDPLGASYNSIQAVISVGSGMFFGRGLGRGTQSQLNFLPERHTDFVFASLSEEMGFVGATALLAVYFFLIWRIFSIAGQTNSAPARYICLGIGIMLLTQVFINVGMNIGILPVTGITLPLVSYGGSSVLATMIGLGIVENIASAHEMS